MYLHLAEYPDTFGIILWEARQTVRRHDDHGFAHA